MDNVLYGALKNTLMTGLNVLSKGIDNTGATSIVDEMNVLSTLYPTAETTLYFPDGDYLVGANYTVPSNFTITRSAGAKFVVDSGVTFNLGSCKIVDSNLMEFFSGDGTVSGTPKIKEAYPEWFGAVGDGITDDSTAFNKTLLLFDEIFISSCKEYLIGEVDILSEKIINGNGKIKKKTSTESAFHIKGENVIITNVKFEGDTTSGQPNCDIKLGDGSKNIRITKCSFNSSIYSAIAGSVDTGSSGELYTVNVSGVVISNNVFNGYIRPLHLHSIDNITINHNIIRDTAYDGIRLRENDGFIIINSNQFVNIGNGNWSDSQTRDAIDTYWSGQNLIITNNIIRETANTGIEIKGFAPDGINGSGKVIISNNQISKCRYSGIFIAGDSDYDGLGNYKFIENVIVNSNIITECNQNILVDGAIGDAAILLKFLYRNISITDNHVISNYSRGIFLNNEVESKEISDSVIIKGNICVNNGHDGLTNSAGIYISAINNVIVEGNFCKNQLDKLNPYQNIGIYISPSGSGYTSTKSTIIKNNMCIDNLNYQIQSDFNNSRINSILSYKDNLEIGTNANWRGVWQHQRRLLFGSASPSSSDGTFSRGDIINNITPSELGDIGSKYVIEGWLCISDGNPGTWVEKRALTGN